jgi:hypothetical protein
MLSEPWSLLGLGAGNSKGLAKIVAVLDWQAETPSSVVWGEIDGPWHSAPTCRFSIA